VSIKASTCARKFSLRLRLFVQITPGYTRGKSLHTEGLYRPDASCVTKQHQQVQHNTL